MYHLIEYIIGRIKYFLYLKKKKCKISFIMELRNKKYSYEHQGTNTLL